MGRYKNASNEELSLYVYMARERLAVAESLQVSIGMTDGVVNLHKALQILLGELRYDLQKVEQEIMRRPEDA